MDIFYVLFFFLFFYVAKSHFNSSPMMAVCVGLLGSFSVFLGVVALVFCSILEEQK